VSDPRILATSIGKTEPFSVTFEVSDELLKTEWRKWSQPLQFRFEERDDGRWDLVMRTLYDIDAFTEALNS
jgi:hypothetical protein